MPADKNAPAGRETLRQRLTRWEREVRDPAAGDGRAATVIFVATLSLLGLHFGVLSREYQRYVATKVALAANALFGVDWWAYLSLLEGAAWSLGCAFFYLVIPGLVVRLVWRERLADHGFTLKGYLPHLKWYLALFVPVGLLVLLVSLQPAFQQKYPFYKEVRTWQDLLVWEIFYGLQFVSLEFFFRGFMIHGTKRRLGIYAVLWMVPPYMMIHFGKPFLEATGAIIAGTVLGFLSLRTGSVFGGATIHILVAVSMDLMALYQKGWFGS